MCRRFTAASFELLLPSTNLSSIVLRHDRPYREAIKPDSILRRILSSAPASLHRLEVVYGDIMELLQSPGGDTTKHQITSLAIRWPDATKARQILQLAGSLETLLITFPGMGVMEILFEKPEVWKNLRNLTWEYGGNMNTQPDRIIPLLPTSLAYLSLDAHVFDLSCLVDLKSSPVHLAFPLRVRSNTDRKIDAIESLRILDHPRFSNLERLEVPPSWIQGPMKEGMHNKGVALTAVRRDERAMYKEHAVWTVGPEQ